MADNYLEKKYDEYLARKAAAEKARRLAWKKRLDAYRKKIGEENKTMEMNGIIHEAEKSRFQTTVDGYTGYVAYRIEDGGLDIRHTVVPEQIGGRGIASALVKAAYDYARDNGLECIATCRYAAVWLERHPEYRGHKSKDWCEDGSCGL